jgi:cation diffusion facilitator CzcD-associated flavoprotein CzcO
MMAQLKKPDFEEEHGLTKYIEFQSRVVSAIWDDAEGIYNVEIEQMDPSGKVTVKKDWCNTLVNCSGILNEWNCE